MNSLDNGERVLDPGVINEGSRDLLELVFRSFHSLTLLLGKSGMDDMFGRNGKWFLQWSFTPFLYYCLPVVVDR